MATSFRSLRILSTAAILAAAFSGCAATPKGPLLLHPFPPESEEYTLSGGALVFRGKEVEVAARPVDWRVVEKQFLEEGAASPLGGGEGGYGAYVFISLRIANSSIQPIVFAAQRSYLRKKGKRLGSTLDLSDIYVMAGQGGDAEERLRSFQESFFDGDTIVASGTSKEKYLAFRKPKGKIKILELKIDDIFLGMESRDLSFLFEVFPGGEE